MAKILYIDDEISALKAISAILKKAGFDVLTATTAEEGISLLKETSVDCLLLDYRLPQMDGIELLKWLKYNGINIPTVMLTAYGTIEKAVEAMKLGAYHYLIKPVDTELLINVLKEAIEKSSILFKEKEKVYSPFPEIIGKSKAMQEVFYIMEMVAESNANVLVTGESGTGKELVARAIHKKSLRNTKPFVIVDCTTIPENLLESELFGHEKGAFTGAVERKTGLFEIANEGTVFLDEIGELPMSLQKKLLRFLQEREIQRIGSTARIKVDVRVISATNRDLEKLVQEGTFREDLYWRLNVVRINLPPLRERKEDIPLLVNHFLNKYSKENNKPIPQLEPEVMDTLINYEWSGNVRELANVIERAIVLSPSGIISMKHLPKRIIEKTGWTLYKESSLNLLEVEKSLILRALNSTGWNQTKAAQVLGISRKQLRTKMKHHGLLNGSIEDE
ncbi:MAG: sigma-54 dependent transcriptional regulator [Thermodesulfovibrio sp.]|uniref:sigma-54-dependent transcriptional regulator n=1 Tax=unclassified Thermodesulfovibrio TaxID=2645936 RepID=UPI00083BA3F7|nr:MULTISPECIES: sigma-54 dependent transcriptional regulator [unclassified Thermodesulfovibrio]MDI1471614.1 sigma-54 dependent transcriptional regulator [Thermodesulfovibrio sp. 1176]MDI6715149.1 sigma-54 dependent transcriptional regulator [Thermodesulfovibrio sp.]ODA44729.1 Response regulator of zinc sigma-54-dependent two-component system [Thermodesulfovibrio sp. N1]